MDDTPETQEIGSGVHGKPGISYDPESVEGEPGQPGVPTGDQYPANKEGDDEKGIVSDTEISGAYPTHRGDPPGEALSSGPAPTKESRDVASLGEVVHGVGAPPPQGRDPGGQSGAGAIPAYEHDESPQGDIDRARAESFPGGVPEDADVGTGRQKGKGLPPGSVGKGQDTPQTPAT